jgi:2-polyprenyl-6-methoxyphenol hydroxylase-like FAD-dependent oxidoreductase
MLFKRQKLLELLYKRLPQCEPRVLTEKKVVSIEANSGGVKVHCDDSSIIEGSVVVGCDGVHSRVRGIMRDLRLKSSGIKLDSETPMAAQYQLLAGYLPRIPHMQPGRVWEVRNNGMSFQIFMLEHEGWFLVYKRLPEPLLQYTNYTDDDAKLFAEDIMDHPVGQDMKFGDLWTLRKWTRLLNLEEGFVQHWHQDRIVLVGDSVHKMTPNAGLSMNQGWQGVVALTNSLRTLLSTNSEPDTEALTMAFEAYKKKTEKMAKDSAFLSKLYCRITSWHNMAYKFADYLGPYLGGDPVTFRLLASPIVKRGLILDFIPEPGHKVGHIQWQNEPYKEEEE